MQWHTPGAWCFTFEASRRNSTQSHVCQTNPTNEICAILKRRKSQLGHYCISIELSKSGHAPYKIVSCDYNCHQALIVTLLSVVCICAIVEIANLPLDKKCSSSRQLTITSALSNGVLWYFVGVLPQQLSFSSLHLNELVVSAGNCFVHERPCCPLVDHNSMIYTSSF